MTTMGPGSVANYNASNALSILGIDPGPVAGQATRLTPQQLAQIIAQQKAWGDEFSPFTNQTSMMPPGAQMPFNIPSPSSAFNMGFPNLGPSYYNGPNMAGPSGMGGGGTAAMQQMLARLMQQSAAMQQYMSGGMGGGMGGGIPGFPGGGMGGNAGVSDPPYPMPEPGESAQEYQQRVKAWQSEQLKEKLTTWNQAMQLESSLYSMEARVADAIIQNMR